MSFRFWFSLLACLALAFFGLDRLISPAALGVLGVALPGWFLAVVSLAWPLCLLGLVALVLARLWGSTAPRDKVKQLREADVFRMLPGLIMALFFLAWVAAYAHVQLLVLVFKIGAACLTGYVAYWMYRPWLPHFRPSAFLASSWRGAKDGGIRIADGQMVPFVVSALAEVAFVCTCMIAVAVSL